MNNEQLLQNYLLNLISISTDMLKEIDVYEVDKVEEVGHILSSLAEFRKNNYIEIPF